MRYSPARGILLTALGWRRAPGSARVPLPVELPQDLQLGQEDRLLDARRCR
jgi:hypothetical protein